VDCGELPMTRQLRARPQLAPQDLPSKLARDAGWEIRATNRLH
jgi:hypothetical protein